jgi:hypothetical protein
MRSILAVLSLFFVAALFEGCGAQMSMMQSTTLVSGKVKIGMTRGEAVYLLGKPQSTETVGLKEFLHYTPVLYALPLASQQSPIAILDGKVVGVGKAYYDGEGQGKDIARVSK